MIVLPQPASVIKEMSDADLVLYSRYLRRHIIENKNDPDFVKDKLSDYQRAVRICAFVMADRFESSVIVTL